MVCISYVAFLKTLQAVTTQSCDFEVYKYLCFHFISFFSDEDFLSFSKGSISRYPPKEYRFFSRGISQEISTPHAS